MNPGDPEPTPVSEEAPANPVNETTDRVVVNPIPPPATRLLVSALLTLIAFFVIYSPWPLIAKLHAVGTACCAQIPSHTITFQGRAMPIDSRNSGIYLGVLLVIAVLWLTGRQQAALYVPSGVRNMLMLCVLAMMFDGFNSVAESHHLHTYYLDTNTIRLVTGTLAGMALTILVVPIYNRLVWRDPAPIAVAEDYVELAGFVIVAVLVIVSLQAAPAALYYPLSVLSITGFLITMTMVNTCVLLVSLRRRNRVGSNSDLFVPALAGLALTCIEILAITSWRSFAHG